MTYSRQEVEDMLENYWGLSGTLRMDLITAFSKLRSSERTVISARGIYGESFVDIGRWFEMSADGARKRYVRGLDKLLEILNGETKSD